MHYLLNEDEYKALALKGEWRTGLNVTEKRLQEICTRVANEMPIKWEWGRNLNPPEPWGCILSKDYEWYCDQCPVQDICPEPHKEWSK